MKKVISIVLALSLMLGVCTPAIYADNSEDLRELKERVRNIDTDNDQYDNVVEALYRSVEKLEEESRELEEKAFRGIDQSKLEFLKNIFEYLKNKDFEGLLVYLQENTDQIFSLFNTSKEEFDAFLNKIENDTGIEEYINYYLENDQMTINGFFENTDNLINYLNENYADDGFFNHVIKPAEKYYTIIKKLVLHYELIQEKIKLVEKIIELIEYTTGENGIQDKEAKAHFDAIKWSFESVGILLNVFTSKEAVIAKVESYDDLIIRLKEYGDSVFLAKVELDKVLHRARFIKFNEAKYKNPVLLKQLDIDVLEATGIRLDVHASLEDINEQIEKINNEMEMIIESEDVIADNDEKSKLMEAIKKARKARYSRLHSIHSFNARVKARRVYNSILNEANLTWMDIKATKSEVNTMIFKLNSLENID